MGLRERKEIQTRESIINEAFKLFCKTGIEATNIADIAKKSNLSRPTLYKYFPTKAQLVDAVYIDNLEKVNVFNLSFDDLNLQEFVTEIMQSLGTILLHQPEILVFDAQYNLYAALNHKDPTKHPSHLFNTPHFSEISNKIHAKMMDEQVSTKGPVDSTLFHIFMPYYEHLQRLAIFSIQRQKEDIEKLKQDLELFNEIYLEWVFH